MRKILLGLAGFVALNMIPYAMILTASSCNPQTMQTLDTLNETSIEAAKLCVQIAKCVGMDKLKIGPYCQLAEDALEFVDKVADDYCPIDAGHE